MRYRFILFIILSASAFAYTQDLPLLKISDDGAYLVSGNNEPFFWLGGTAWELIHRLDSIEIDRYLSDRAEKGFTVIQTVILAELDGLNTPNAYGHKPLLNNDPTTFNEEYFQLVDYVINRAGELGLYIGLLPTWGDKFNKKWGAGPEIFNPENSKVYGELLAKRYLSHPNLIWILGGDRAPENDGHFKTIRAMAEGIRTIDQEHLITYHPVGAKKASDFFDEQWLDLDMYQSGHSRKAREYAYVFESQKSAIKRPLINGEARYENIMDRFWEDRSYGWLDDADVRVSAYWSMIAGAAGYTYGCNDIWQMYDYTREPVIQARTGWSAALDLPGSTHMKYMKFIFELLPWQEMHSDQSVIFNENPENESYMVSALGENKDFMVAYTPKGNALKVDLSKINAEIVKAFWFNPRSGKISYIDEFETKNPGEFKPWSEGWGSDFLLVLLADELAASLNTFITK